VLRVLLVPLSFSDFETGLVEGDGMTDEAPGGIAGMVRVSDWDRHRRGPTSSMRLAVAELLSVYRGPDGAVWARPDELEAAMVAHGERVAAEARAVLHAKANARPRRACSICGKLECYGR